MNELAEKIDELLIRQGDIFVDQLRELISGELANAISRQFGVMPSQAPLSAPNSLALPEVPVNDNALIGVNQFLRSRDEK